MAGKQAEQNTPDYLNMSDEDMLNMGEPPVVQDTDEDIPEDTKEDESKKSQEVDQEDQDEDNEEDEGADADEDEADADQAEGESKEADEAATENIPDQKPDSEKKDGEDKEKDKEPSKKDAPAIDYEAEYKRILAPFKANGREVEVKTVDDAITLMQMGANYNKKMAALKPNLKVLKLLENNGLLDETKLSFLIELDRKNPEAINKLVKDSGIDPMDFDAEKAGEYKPRIHTVDDREIVLDTVLDEIQDSPSYNRTLGIVSKEWDGASKQVIAEHPQLLKVINDHVERGIYDLINAEIERERMLGRLTGMSDLEAYRQVGDAIQARGGFDHLNAQEMKNTPEKKVVTPAPKKEDDDKLKEKKRAASSTKPAGSVSANQDDFDPLSMSDEEFAKLAEKRFR